MPIHDWTGVDAAIFHAFHHNWITEIARALNRGLLPASCYALPEPIIPLSPTFANAGVVRHVSNHQLVGIVNIVSPYDSRARRSLNNFAHQMRVFLTAGTHLLLIDLFPPNPSDPRGIHGAIWAKDCPEKQSRPTDKTLTCVAYKGDPGREAYLDLLAVGDALPDMPLFLTPDTYVPVPLEATYLAAWDGMAAYWRDVLAAG